MDEWISIEPEPKRPDIDPYAECLAEEAIREYEEDIRAGIAMGNRADNLSNYEDYCDEYGYG